MQPSGIYIGLGANLANPVHGAPLQTLAAAVRALEVAGITIIRRSPWYESAPIPASDQPWFVNGVVEVGSDLPPEALLQSLHRVETAFGRVRSEPNAPRTLDLDLLDYAGTIRNGDVPPILPHPRLLDRAFVLLPLRDIAPGWRHPVSGSTVAALIAALPSGQQIRKA
jgi:2-amino-4-hydroxy-6-hydroxymethyldihydropteridine diphosphokinase